MARGSFTCHVTKGSLRTGVWRAGSSMRSGYMIIIIFFTSDRLSETKITVFLEAKNIICGTSIINQRLLRSIWLRKQYEMVSPCFCGVFLLSLIPFLSSLVLLLSLSLECITSDFPTHSHPSSHTLPLSLRGPACCCYSARGVGSGCQACQQARRFLYCLESALGRWGLGKGMDGCLPPF